MANQIVTSEQFIPSEHLMYTRPRINAVGGKSVGILNKSTRKSLMIQVPFMLNWGAMAWGEDANKTFSMSLQFPRKDFTNDKVDAFLNMLQEMETKIKQDAVANCKDWFGKNMSEEVINAFFNPILKYPKNKETGEPDLEREPTLKIKLPSWEGEYKFELFDTSNNLLIPNNNGEEPDVFITKGSEITTIIQCGGIWFANGSFGVSWKLYQGVVKPSETLKRGTCHIQIADSDRPQSSESKPATTDNTVIESDDEEQEEEEVVESSEEQSSEEVVEEQEAVEEQEEVVEEKPKKRKVSKKKAST